MFTAFYALIKSAVRCKPGSRRPKYLVTRGGNRHHGRDDGMIGRWIRGFSHRHMAFGPVTVKPDGEIHLQRIDHFINRHKEWPQCPATVKTKQGSHFLRTHFMADVLSLDNRCCNAAPRAMRYALPSARQPWHAESRSPGASRDLLYQRNSVARSSSRMPGLTISSMNSHVFSAISAARRARDFLVGFSARLAQHNLVEILGFTANVLTYRGLKRGRHTREACNSDA